MEDYRGYIVKERVWEEIHAFNVEKLSHPNSNLSTKTHWKYRKKKIGIEYLTDGDTKGTYWKFQTQDCIDTYTFPFKENGVGEASEPMYIDLKKMRPVSEIRFYAYRHIGKKGVCS